MEKERSKLVSLKFQKMRKKVERKIDGQIKSEMLIPDTKKFIFLIN